MGNLPKEVVVNIMARREASAKSEIRAEYVRGFIEGALYCTNALPNWIAQAMLDMELRPRHVASALATLHRRIGIKVKGKAIKRVEINEVAREFFRLCTVDAKHIFCVQWLKEHEACYTSTECPLTHGHSFSTYLEGWMFVEKQTKNGCRKSMVVEYVSADEEIPLCEDSMSESDDAT